MCSVEVGSFMLVGSEIWEEARPWIQLQRYLREGGRLHVGCSRCGWDDADPLDVAGTKRAVDSATHVVLPRDELVAWLDPVCACPVCGVQPWVNIDCGMCSYMSDAPPALRALLEEE